MSNVVPFRSRQETTPAILAGAGGLQSPARAQRAGSIEGIRNLILDLDHINTYSRILMLQVADETAQRQLMANADNIEALIRMARTRLEDVLQGRIVQASLVP